MIKQSTQHLANKLFMIFYNVKTTSMYDNNTRWVSVAKEVERMMIENNTKNKTRSLADDILLRSRVCNHKDDHRIIIATDNDGNLWSHCVKCGKEVNNERPITKTVQKDLPKKN